MSRPTKLTPETREKILDALRKGNYRVVACKYAGVSTKTFCEWMRRGEDDPDSDFGSFRQAVLEAEARVEMEAVGVLSDPSNPDTKRLLEFLARKFPERWSSDTYRLRQLEKELAELKKIIDVPGEAGAEDTQAPEVG